MFGAVAEAYFAQDVKYLLLAFSFGYAKIFQLEVYVFFHRQLVDEVETLEDEPDTSFAVTGSVFLFQVSHFFPIQQVAAFVRVVQQTENMQQGRFAASAWTHDGDELALFHFHAYAVECDGFYFFRPEAFAEILYFNHDSFRFL